MKNAFHTLNRIDAGIGMCLIGLALATNAQEPPLAVRASSEAQITERGPHHRVWTRAVEYVTPGGKVMTRHSSYVELATGLHYLKDGQWVDSQPVIEIFKDGAVGRQSQHQVIFAANVNDVGAVDLLTPDGKRFRSRILGIAYSDAVSGQIVVIAETQDSIGEVQPPNQVLYADAFKGLKASVRYTYTVAGLEQDVIFEEDPPAPEVFGLDSATARLEVWTEFFDPPEPQKKTLLTPPEKDPQKRQLMAEPDLIDERLDFGAMKMNSGRAFLTAGEKQADPQRISTPVRKEWGQTEGRTFLLERIEYKKAKPSLDSLPKSAAVTKDRKDSMLVLRQRNGRIEGLGSRSLVGRPTVKTGASRPMQMASAPKVTRGFVLDYAQLLSQTNFTFKGDTTYFLSGGVSLSGDTILEGGAVIKFTNAYYVCISILSNLTCQTDPYRPAVFTSMHDNSVGETITGSTGSPERYSVYAALVLYPDNLRLENIRVAYADYAVMCDAISSLYVNNLQALKNYVVLYNLYEGTSFDIDNSIFYDNEWSLGGGEGCNVSGRNLTFDRGIGVVGGGGIYDYWTMTNCLIVAVTNWGYGGVQPTATNSTVKVDNEAGVFQAVGAGYCYLATNSPYRDCGSTNLPASLLSDLARRTTYPPVVYSNYTISADTVLGPQATRDTDMPDLGYHYAPIDYACSSLYVSNAVLTMTNGATLATFGSLGLLLQGNSPLISAGTPLNHNHFVRYNTAQEQLLKWGTEAGFNYAFYGYRFLTNVTADFRFTDFSALAGLNYMHLFESSGGYGFESLRARDCELYNGNIELGTETTYYESLNNCLLHRVSAFYWSGCTLDLYNNLFYGGTQGTDYDEDPPLPCNMYDNVYDQTTIDMDTIFNNGHNAYINTVNGSRINPTNAYDIVTNVFVYHTGPLGRFYQPTNSCLINAGSRNATNAGLYHYTVTTNQVKETNSIVDIGYHYVALDANGNPDDYDADGLPDYIEDLNGNGVRDGSESSWLLSNTDGDTVNDYLEWLLGRNPNASDSFPDTNSVNLRVFTPLK